MGLRVDLHAILVSVLGSSSVYFQPKSDSRMEYPCIIYSIDYLDIDHASNNPYRVSKRYIVTSISRNPDNGVLDKLALLPTASFNRRFVADGLYHDVFTLYF